ncbi:MAG: Rrf2 family transcriptional regulator [Candidatus Kryptonium sp.]
MSGLLSKTAEYGMRAVLYIALNQSNNKKYKKRISTKDIAKNLKVPYHFLAKVIQKLVKAGIIHSKRSKNGGFFLKKSPEKVKLLDVVLALEGKELFTDCVLGLPNCSDKNPCPVHDYWKVIREEIKQMLSDKTVKELLNGEFKI